MATAAFTSQGRGRMSRGLMVRFVTTAPSATATSTPAPALRVRRKHSSTRPRRIHSSPWLLVLVKTATSGSSTGLCHACMASSMASSFTGLPSFPHSLPESAPESNSPLPAAARFSMPFRPHPVCVPIAFRLDGGPPVCVPPASHPHPAVRATSAGIPSASRRRRTRSLRVPLSQRSGNGSVEAGHGMATASVTVL